jgi:hypothetical protein
MVQASERDMTFTGAAHAAERYMSRGSCGVRFTGPAPYDTGEVCSMTFLRNLLKSCDNRLHRRPPRSCGPTPI